MARPGFLLDQTFADLSGWWLKVECCGRTVAIPLRGLALQRPRARFGDLLQALRCKDCGTRPQRVVLTDDATDQARGRGAAPVAWRLILEIPTPAGPR